LEEGRAPVLCVIFHAESDLDPVFWRASPHRQTRHLIAENVNWMFTTKRFANMPVPSAVLAGIPADVFFAALSGRLFGDDPSDASGETAAIFRLALAFLPSDLPLDDMLAAVKRYRLGAWPLFGMGRVPESMEKFARWLPLPELSGVFSIKNRSELDELLESALKRPGGHSAYQRAPVLAATAAGE